MVSRGLGLEPEAGDRKTRKIYRKQEKEFSNNTLAELTQSSDSRRVLWSLIKCMPILMHPGFRRML
jgi:hypothetical protein